MTTRITHTNITHVCAVKSTCVLQIYLGIYSIKTTPHTLLQTTLQHSNNPKHTHIQKMLQIGFRHIIKILSRSSKQQLGRNMATTAPCPQVLPKPAKTRPAFNALKASSFLWARNNQSPILKALQHRHHTRQSETSYSTHSDTSEGRQSASSDGGHSDSSNDQQSDNSNGRHPFSKSSFIGIVIGNMISLGFILKEERKRNWAEFEASLIPKKLERTRKELDAVERRWNK